MHLWQSYVAVTGIMRVANNSGDSGGESAHPQGTNTLQHIM